MAGVTPDAGEEAILNHYLKLDNTGRGTGNLILGLFTNTSGLGETSVWGDITQPATQGGYFEQSLSSSGWVVSGGDASRPSVSFTAAGPGFSAPIYGYYIRSPAATPVLLHFEVDPNAPVTVNDGESYVVDLSNVLD